jgi:hypothetical protein
MDLKKQQLLRSDTSTAVEEEADERQSTESPDAPPQSPPPSSPHAGEMLPPPDRVLPDAKQKKESLANLLLNLTPPLLRAIAACPSNGYVDGDADNASSLRDSMIPGEFLKKSTSA